jgi:hypothetical protein
MRLSIPPKHNCDEIQAISEEDLRICIVKDFDGHPNLPAPQIAK